MSETPRRGLRKKLPALRRLLALPKIHPPRFGLVQERKDLLQPIAFRHCLLQRNRSILQFSICDRFFRLIHSVRSTNMRPPVSGSTREGMSLGPGPPPPTVPHHAQG
jgi:hypothetical protein